MKASKSKERPLAEVAVERSLRIENVSYAYGRIPALRTVSTIIDRCKGSVTAVLGPNASGKSTLLRCIIGALRPQSGRVLLDGRPVDRLRPRALAARVAYVPQRSIVSAAFTVRQVVELGRYALPPSAERINEVIQRLDLKEIENRPHRALSVGQQQRVTLARALAQLGDGGVLVLDEPTSAMDLQHSAQTHQLLRHTANDRGAAVILAMHDLPLASAIADELWLLDGGRLVAAGSTCEVLTTERLETVFGVRFEWHTDSRGRSRLLPELPPNSRGE